MAVYNVFSNLVGSPALRGESIACVVYPSQAATYFGGMCTFPNPFVHTPLPMRCQIYSSGSIGWLSFVDLYGTSFKVSPAQSDGNLASSGTPGIFGAGDRITVFNVGS